MYGSLLIFDIYPVRVYELRFYQGLKDFRKGKVSDFLKVLLVYLIWVYCVFVILFAIVYNCVQCELLNVNFCELSDYYNSLKIFKSENGQTRLRGSISIPVNYQLPDLEVAAVDTFLCRSYKKTRGYFSLFVQHDERDFDVVLKHNPLNSPTIPISLPGTKKFL